MIYEEKAKVIRQKYKTCGVYLLIFCEEVVYVGQSFRCELRVGQHESEQAKEFDSYAIIPCEESKVDHLEARLIEKYKPRFNRHYPNVQQFARR